MAQPQQQAFSRLQHPDPKINAIVQDLYDKLQQIQAQVATLAAKVTAIKNQSL